MTLSEGDLDLRGPTTGWTRWFARYDGVAWSWFLALKITNYALLHITRDYCKFVRFWNNSQ